KLPGLASRDMVYRSKDGTLVGHVSVTQVYARAWLIHQLATLSNRADTGACREALYGLISTLPALVHGAHTAIIGYFNRKRSWHQLSLQDFVDWIDDPAQAVVTSLDRFERASDAPDIEIPPIAGVEVGEARPDEILAASALARAQLPRIAADAFDIDPRRLVTDHLGASGSKRARRALVLRLHGRVAGVALCETGPRQLSLFSLFNQAQIFLCPAPAAPPVGAQLALLAAVYRFFRERNVTDPIVVAPVGTLAATADPGTHLEEAMGCVVLSGRSVRRWENFLKFQLGHHFHERAANGNAIAPARKVRAT